MKVFHVEHSPSIVDSWTVSTIISDTVQYGFGDTFLEAMKNIADLIEYDLMLKEHIDGEHTQ